jgi:hypothetical protein
MQTMNIHMNVKAKMIPIETTPGTGGGEIKNSRGGKFT